MTQWTNPIGCALVIALAGCANVRPPDFTNPGPAGYQRALGDYYDPYPLDDVAPPVVGGRPREYQRPVPEVERARQFSRPRTAPPAVVVSPFTPTPTLTAPLPPPPSAVPYSQPVQAPQPSFIRPPY